MRVIAADSGQGQWVAWTSDDQTVNDQHFLRVFHIAVQLVVHMCIDDVSFWSSHVPELLGETPVGEELDPVRLVGGANDQGDKPVTVSHLLEARPDDPTY